MERGNSTAISSGWRSARAATESSLTRWSSTRRSNSSHAVSGLWERSSHSSRRASESRVCTACTHTPATAEAPALVQVRGEDRLARVRLERWRGGAVPPPRLAVALPAPDRVVELSPHPQRLDARRATRLFRESEGHDVLARVLEEGREGLEVGEHVAPLALREPLLPGRHGRAGEAFVDRAQHVLVRGQLAARGRADLVDRAGEIARPGQHVRRRRPIPGARVAVTAGAPFHIDALAGGGVLSDEGAGSGERYARGGHEQRHPKQESALSHDRSPLPAPRSSPTFSASIRSDHKGRGSPTRSRAR